MEIDMIEKFGLAGVALVFAFFFWKALTKQQDRSDAQQKEMVGILLNEANTIRADSKLYAEKRDIVLSDAIKAVSEISKAMELLTARLEILTNEVHSIKITLSEKKH